MMQTFRYPWRKIKLTLRPNGSETSKVKHRSETRVLENNYFIIGFSHCFTLKGLHHICSPWFFENILLTAASRTLWKQPPMCVLNFANSKSCGKSSEIHFCWGSLGSIFKWIPIVIFIRILQLKHCRKRHYLLFCTVLLWHRDLKCWYWVGLRNKIGWIS